MKQPALVLALSAWVSIASAPAAIAISTSAQAKRASAAPSAAQLSAPAPVKPPAEVARPVSHRFPVNDEKGLLLTCVAPEIETNPDTDLFEHCALAPGRTLDDVMHSFVSALHYVQKEQAKERDGGREDVGAKAAQAAEPKEAGDEH